MSGALCKLRDCGNVIRGRSSAGYCTPRCQRVARREAADLARAPLGTLPVEWTTLRTCYQVDEHRRLDCRRYDRCLDYVEAKMWDGFSCSQCRGYVQITDEQRLVQLAAAMRLYAAVGGELWM